MTPEYANVLKHIKETAARDMKLKQEALQRTQDRANEMVEILSRATAEYIATGIFNASDTMHMWDMHYHGVGFGHKGWVWERYAKRLAKELNRPYVSVSASRYGMYLGRINNEHTYGPGARYIFVTKRKYTSPLVSMFMLLENCANVQVFGDYWRVTLASNEEGHAAYDVWRNECASNPGYLRALRIIK